MKKLPDFVFENEYWKEGFAVIGIDEVGRGAFAGPVCVGGVVFKPSMSNEQLTKILALGINDSKKLSPKKREELSLKIKEEATAFHVSYIDVSIINEVGIGKATFLGMEKVIKSLKLKIQSLKPFLLIDAYEIPGVSKDKQKGIVRGDSLSISIAAASIIAKVARDELMVELGLRFPNYGFERNKGYGTEFHREAIKKHGQTEHHRKVFCRNVWNKVKKLTG